MKITPTILREWNACYSDEEIAGLFGDRESVALLDVLDSEIQDQDKVWVASHALGGRDARLFACWCAESALPEDCDPRSRAAVDVARRYAHGTATTAELDAAWAAREAAWGAALEAARGAALEAAWGAALESARGSTRAAARDVQVARLRAHVTGEEPLR